MRTGPEQKPEDAEGKDARMDFSGKTVVVTGSGSGIGAAAAQMFADAGAEVVATQNVTPAVSSFRRVSMNLADPASIAAAVKEMPAKIDFLVNIAGLGADGAEPEKILAVNFTGTRLFTESLLDRVSPKGCVLTTSSIASRYWRRDIETVKQFMAIRDFGAVRAFWDGLGQEHQAAYNLCKQAVTVWTFMMASTHAAGGPRFNVVSPGFTDTPMLQKALANANPTVRALALANPNMAKPEDVAPVYLALCSDAFRVVNGGDIAADSGLFANKAMEDFKLGDA